MSPVHRLSRVPKAIADLLQAGVTGPDANRLIAAHQEDERRPVVVLPLPGEPREGDRIRIAASGPSAATALRVLIAAPAGPGRWAICGDPVPAGDADVEVRV